MPHASEYTVDIEYEKCSSDDGLLSQEASSFDKHKHRKSRSPYLVHIAAFFLYTIIFLLAVGVLITRPDHGPNLIYSPARSAVSFERRVFDGSFVIENPFTGKPRPELDAAWHDLLQNANIRVSKETLDRVNGSSIAFSDGDGYYAQLGMFHELHCLKRVRHFIHKDYYHPDQSAEARQLDALHTDHCLEILRQGVMCRGDISLVTFVWSPNKRVPLADFTRPHECVNFDSLNQWSGEHSVDAFDPGLLYHPTLGASFPTGDGEVDGV